MAENSKIEWTDHTFNPWVGCTKVSPACDHCYAESWAKRTGSPELWQGQRRRTTEANWRKPIKWNAEAERLGVRYKVFCASLADVFDNMVSFEWREDLYRLIRATPNLDWLLLSKRIGNAGGMLPLLWDAVPNLWIGATVVNQEEADRDIPKLLDVKQAGVRFLSVEPMLEHISARTFMPWPMTTPERRYGVGLDWVICGGESGPGARPMNPDWARSLRDQCQATDTAFLFKQWGEWAPGECAGGGPPTRTEETATWWNDRWDFGRITPRESEELHRDDEPDLYRFGKATAGRHIDGRTWDEMPKAKDTAHG